MSDNETRAWPWLTALLVVLAAPFVFEIIVRVLQRMAAS